MRKLAALCVISLVGCGGYEGDALQSAAQAVETEPATIQFNPDWSHNVVGTIRAGSELIVDYPQSRLPTCRATYNGYATWEIQVQYRIDGGDIVSVPVTRVEGMERVAAPATIALPNPSSHIEMWFKNTDRAGCVAWDSAYGQNYHFDIGAAATETTIHFNADWSEVVQGALVGGGTVTVHFDPARLPTCRATKYGYDAWSIIAYYRFDGGQVQSAPVTTGLHYIQVPVPATLDIPQGAQNLEMWFFNSDYAGCTAWDSNYSANYWFSIE